MTRLLAKKMLNFCGVFCTLVPFMLLIGCASSGSENAVITSGRAAPTLLTEAEVLKYVEEWQQAKPGIARLTELESDLTFLIAEVSKMSDLNTAPQRYAEDLTQPDSDLVQNGGNVIVGSMASANVVSKPAIVDTAQQSASTSYGLHLASFLQPYSAKFGWYLVNKEYPTLFNGLNPKLQLIKQPNQTRYSLRVGPFASEAQAIHTCNKLKQRNYYCVPTDFSGEPLVEI